MSRAGRTRHASGTRVGGGRLRVDAARAVHKLRDYQLADPAMWALEAVRAAAASGAEAVHVDGDSDDVWVGWSGAPLDRDALPRLLDELVSPQASEDRRALRLLATAINTALGLGPRWVDVYTIDDEGVARVRYAPELLRATEDGSAEGLRNLATTDATLPAGAPAIARGNVVHLRRFPALEALSLLATGQEPREVRLARRACEDFAVPLRIARGTLGLHHASGDLLRVRLDPRKLGEGCEAFLAIVDPSAARAEAWVDFAELGVVLATHSLEISVPFVSGARIPIRARVEAPRLPTNASRSGVRTEERWIASIVSDLSRHVKELVARLARELGDEPEGSWTPERRARLRAAALQLVAAWCGGPHWRANAAGGPIAIPDVLAPLFDAPLARDAVGRARSVRDLARGSGSSVVHAGPSPLPEELTPWVGEIPWVPPGDPLALLWGGAPPPSARDLVAHATKSRAARERWLAKPQVMPVLEAGASHVLVVPLEPPGRSARSCVPERLLRRKGMAGEVAIVRSSSSAASIDLVVDGRITESMRVSAPLPYVAIATAPDLELTADHDRVAATEARRALIEAVDAAVVLGCEAVARRLREDGKPAPKGERARWCEEGERLDRVAAARMVRTGVRLALRLLERAGASDAARALRESKSPLLDAPAWPSIAGDHRSISELFAMGRSEGGAIGYVQRRSRDEPALAERPVLFLDALERDLLAALLERVPLVDYGAFGRSPSASEVALGLGARCVAAIEIEEPGYRGAFGWCDGRSTVEHSHGGRFLRGAAAAPAGAHPYALRIDDDRVVPSDDGAALRWRPGGAPYDQIRELEARLACAIADAALGRETKGLRSPAMSPLPSWPVLSALFRACDDLAPSAAKVLGRDRITALRALPMLPRALTTALGSVDQLAKDFGGELVFLPPETPGLGGLALSGWHPLVADEDIARGIGRLFHLRTSDGSSELATRVAEMRRAARLAAHMRRPEQDVALRASDVSVRIAGQGIRGVLGIDRRSPPSTRVDVLVERRAFETRTEPLPHLVAVVDVDADLVGGELDALTESAISRIRGALREGSAELVVQLADRMRAPLAQDDAAFRFVREWLKDASTGKKRTTATRAISALRKARMFEALSGGLASIDDATRGRALYLAEPVERWLGPADGEARSPLDEAILVVPPHPEHPLGALLRALTAHDTRSVTAEVRRLQAARRVRWGLAQRPQVSRVREMRFRWTLEQLAEVAAPSERDAFESLGLGELALVGGDRTSVELFASGERVVALDWDLRPAIVVACEPTTIVPSGPRLRDADRAALERAVRVVLARAVRHVVDTVEGDALPGWVRAALRESALLGGRAHVDAIADVPVFETTEDRWVTPAELDAQVTRFGKLWVTTDTTSTARPLDPERVAVRLPRADAMRMAHVYATEEADGELRLDAIARRNRDRPRVRAIGPSALDAGRALATETVAPGRDGIEAVVLALHPGHASARAMHAFRDRHQLGTVDDPASWPALSWVDSPAFTPDRTWAQPADDAALRDAKLAIVAACERAIDGVVDLPGDALATIRVDRTLSTQVLSGRSAQVRGALWIEVLREPSVVVIDAYGESEHALTTTRAPGGRESPLPLGGRLYVTGVAGTGATSALASIASHAYERMVHFVAARLDGGKSPMPDLDLAELVRAAALGYVQEEDRAGRIALPFVVGKKSNVGRLVRAILAGDPVLLAPADRRAHALELGWKGPILIDDGSLAVRRAVVALGEQVTSLDRALADRVLDAPAPVAPEPAPAPAFVDVSVPAPPPERPRAPAATPATPPPAHPVLAALDTLLRTSAAARGRHPAIRIDPVVATPLAALATDGAVDLAAQHPAVQQLRAREHPEALAILAAHALGASVRGNDDAATAESHAILALLLAR